MSFNAIVVRELLLLLLLLLPLLLRRLLQPLCYYYYYYDGYYYYTLAAHWQYITWIRNAAVEDQQQHTLLRGPHNLDTP